MMIGYTAKILDTFEYSPGGWKGLRVGIFLISPEGDYPFGFVAGCVWGDDSSWKIQYLDLSAVEKGEIRRDARFGYIEMPSGISLKQAIDLVDYGYDDLEPYSYTALIAIRKRFDLRDGQIVE
jgi:hypothetical protein